MSHLATWLSKKDIGRGAGRDNWRGPAKGGAEAVYAHCGESEPLAATPGRDIILVEAVRRINTARGRGFCPFYTAFTNRALPPGHKSLSGGAQNFGPAWSSQEARCRGEVLKNIFYILDIGQNLTKKASGENPGSLMFSRADGGIRTHDLRITSACITFSFIS